MVDEQVEDVNEQEYYEIDELLVLVSEYFIGHFGTMARVDTLERTCINMLVMKLKKWKLNYLLMQEILWDEALFYLKLWVKARIDMLLHMVMLFLPEMYLA